jgi:hypothetical protein
VDETNTPHSAQILERQFQGWLIVVWPQAESWLFNDAPRTLRLRGIEKIPDLIEKLIADTEDTAKRIKAKLDQAKQLAAAVNSIADKR